jgi:hypothetical protein
MAVDFSLLPPRQPVPENGPSPVFWSFVFVALAVAGAMLALWSWSAKEPAQTLWFWACVIVIPACGAGALVLQRFSHFQRCRNRAIAGNVVRERYLNRLFDAASAPLAVLATDYRVHADDDEQTLEAMLARSATPLTRPARHSRERIVASCLEPGVAALTFDDVERHSALLQWILEGFAPAIMQALEAVPARIPVAMRLEVASAALDPEAIWSVWNGLPDGTFPARLGQPVLGPEGDLWVIDAMLDQTDPVQRDVITVMVSVNLNAVHAADPPQGSAEAACMFVLCPIALARQERLAVRGWMHRPQSQSKTPEGNALHYALKWGRTSAPAIGGLIHTGWDEQAIGLYGAALRAEAPAGGALSRVNHALETLVGNAGTTSPWLAAALALRRAMEAGVPYLVGGQQEEQALLAVVAPEQQDTLNNEEIPD